MRRWMYFCRTCIKEYAEKFHLLYLGIGRKTVDADILARICRAATPSLAYYNSETNMDLNSFREIMSFFLERGKGTVPSKEKYDNSNIQEALDLVKEYGLSDNVNIICTEAEKKDDATLGKVETIEIKNLFVRGKFFAEFNHLESMKLSNNVFLDSVSIGVIGITIVLDAVFRENYFKKGAWFKVFGVKHMRFYQNKFIGGSLSPDDRTMLGLDGNAMRIDFAPPSLTSPNLKVDAAKEWMNEYFPKNHRYFIEMHLEFNGNVIKNLSITDNHKFYDVKHEPFGKIYFRGKNRIFQLNMSTRHSVISPKRYSMNDELKTKADVDRVFFDTSDEVGVIPEDVKLIFTGEYIEKSSIDRMYAMWWRGDYASYGEFFTDLQEKAAKKNNRVLESIYARKARSYSRVFMSSKEDRFIFWWGDIISNGGTSWIKPLFWLLFVQTSFAAIAWFVPFVEVTCPSFSILWWEFLDPLSGLPSIKYSGWGANCLSLLHKLVAVLMLYESAKAMRRFS